MSETKKAFDVGLYLNLPWDEVVAKATPDLSALSHEASPNRERVTYFDSTDITGLQWNNPENRQASYAALDTETLIQTTKEKSIVVWISPPSKTYAYPDTRITIFFVTANPDGGLPQMENYGIRLPHDLTDCSQLHQRLTYISDTPARPPMADEFDIRSTPLRIPLRIPVEFNDVAPSLIPLEPDIWEYITSGQAKKDNLESKTAARKAAQIVAQGLLGLSESPSEIDLLHIGMQAEKHMSDSGWAIQGSGSGCGLSNTEIFTRSSSASAFESNILYSSNNPKYDFVPGQKYYVNFCGICCGSIHSEMTYGHSYCPHPQCGRFFGPDTHTLRPEKSLQTAPRLQTPEPENVFYNPTPVKAWGWLPDWWKTLTPAS